MKREVSVNVKGRSPLLMHRFPETQIEALEKRPKEEQAEISAYRSPNGTLYVPGIAIQRTLIGGAAYSKGKGRASLQKPVAACVMVTPEYVTIAPQEYVVDSRPVVMPSTRGRVMRYRPRFDAWEISFLLEYDDVLLSEPQMRKIADDSFDRVGLLDFRPACKGSFGRGFITQWKDAGA